MSTVKLKLLIDLEKNEVVFAESDKEFIDILLSFLTLPMGTIIRLLNKQSSVGCIDNIYRSIEDLDTKCLNTEACKTMLLEPRSSSERLCENLTIRVDNLEPRRLHRCPNFDCYTKKTKAFSSVAGVNCSCGKSMNERLIWKEKKKGKQDVFLRGGATYIISNNLHIFPAAISNAVPFYRNLGIDNVEGLEKRVVDVNRDEILTLLRMLLLSKTPLTDVFLKKPCSDAKKETKKTRLSHVKLEDGSEDRCMLKCDKNTKIQKECCMLMCDIVKKAFSRQKETEVILKLICDKNTKRVLCAEADHVMVDTFFSFLTFPLGSIVKLLNKKSALGCVDNLYNSVAILDSNSDCFVSEIHKKMLLSPCLYLHYDCSHQMLKIESELVSRTGNVYGCKICFDKGADKCEHNIGMVSTKEINPKMQNLVTENGGGFANKLTKFMITNEMIITPQSLISGIDVIKGLKVSAQSLVFQEVAIGEAEVLNMLKSCLTSCDVLTSAFSSVRKSSKLY